MKLFSPVSFAWLAAYLVAMGLVVWMVTWARSWAIATYDTPAAHQQWEQYREEEGERQESGDTPVKRHVARTDDPPALVMLQDNFGVSLGGALLLSTAVFAAIAFLARGALTASPRPLDGDNEPEA
jgi:hypothetical protein